MDKYLKPPFGKPPFRLSRPESAREIATKSPVNLWKRRVEIATGTATIQIAAISKDLAFLLTVGSFLLTVELFYLQLTILAFLLTVGAFPLTFSAFYLQLELFAKSGKVRLISASRDCKQRSLTVSKKAATASKKASPNFKSLAGWI